MTEYSCGTDKPSPASSLSSKSKSAVSNGSRSFAVGGDGRGAWSRRQRDIAALHVSDIGGSKGASEAMLSLCRRAATLEVLLEQIEADLSEGKEVNLDIYGRLAGHLRRILETIGIKRAARDITPDFHSYVAAKSKGAGA